MLTMIEIGGPLSGRTVAWIGDYNNVARSLCEAGAMLGAHLRLGCPVGYDAAAVELERFVALGAASVEQFARAADAVIGAEAVHTDTWTSMGQEAQAEHRRRAFEGFQVNESLMAAGRAGSVVLPLHAGASRRGGVVRGVRRASLAGVPARSQPTRCRSWRACLPRRGSMSTKVQRQQAISRLIGQRAVSSQPQLVELLAEEGIVATQATVSRDLEDLGAVKVRVPGGETVYAIPEYEPDRLAPEDQLRRVMGEWVAEVKRSGNLVVLRTPPGCAHVVASALDRSGLEGILGTVAGDDTLLVVAEELAGGADVGGQRLADRLRDLAGLPVGKARR